VPRPGGRLRREDRGSRADLDSRVVERLCVESTELVDVLGVADVVAFKCLEAVGAWSGQFGY
jgi:hypothetical protein